MATDVCFCFWNPPSGFPREGGVQFRVSLQDVLPENMGVLLPGLTEQFDKLDVHD